MPRLLKILLLITLAVTIVCVNHWFIARIYDEYQKKEMYYHVQVQNKENKIVELNKKVDLLGKKVVSYDDNRNFACSGLGVAFISNKEKIK